MNSSLIVEYRQGPCQATADLAGLQAYLAHWVGEPFRFARVSYGDELTLHFGDLRPARSPKLMKQLYGTYILGFRGSAWMLKSGSEALVVTAGILPELVAAGLGKQLVKEELESNPIIQPQSRVLVATPFILQPLNAFGLQLRVADGSSLLILPTVEEADNSEDDALPELADWELLSPRGLLSAGPGLQWSFKPSAGPVTVPT